LGSDPHKADTDGDGVRDGDDPCPSAGPARDDRGRALAETIRYLIRFQQQRWASGNQPSMASILDAGPAAAEIPHSAGLVLFQPGERMGTEISVAKVEAKSDSAQVVLRWSPGSGRNTDVFSLRKLAGTWRVIGVERTERIME